MAARLAALCVGCLALVLPGTADAQRLRSFEPTKALFAVTSSRGLPEPGSIEEPGAEDLAPGLGLVKTEQVDASGNVYWRHESSGMLFVFIPGGAYPMGSHYSDIFSRQQVAQSIAMGRVDELYLSSEQPQRPIYVSPFFMGVYEVTVGDYRRFLEAAERGEVARFHYPTQPRRADHTPFLWEEELAFWEDDRPIVGISWISAYAFCRWLGGRLPTEAEWEKAARGTDGRIFPWGNRFDPMRANTAESMNRSTLPVGVYDGGRSPYGCHDMAGNVMEYCFDAYDPDVYRHRRNNNHCLLEVDQDEPSRLRVTRGGSWTARGLLFKARTTARGRIPSKLQFSPGYDPLEYLHIGFRVALSPQADLYPEGWLEGLKKRRAEDWKRQQGRKDAAGDDLEESGDPDGSGSASPPR